MEVLVVVVVFDAAAEVGVDVAEEPAGAGDLDLGAVHLGEGHVPEGGGDREVRTQGDRHAEGKRRKRQKNVGWAGN